MFKNMKLWIKLLIGFGLVLLVTTAVATFSMLRFRQVAHLSHSVQEYGQLRATINDRIRDHLTWVNTIKTMFLDERITTLDLETDGKKCALGKWLDSRQARDLGNRFPELKALLEKLREPHEQLHASAIQIKELYQYDALVKAKNHQAEEYNNLDKIARSFDAAMSDIMQNKVDPLKLAAEKALDVEGMARLGAVDMQLSDNIIAPFLKFRTNVEQMPRIQSSVQWSACVADLAAVEKGIEQWRQTVKDYLELSASADELQTLIGNTRTAAEGLYEAIQSQQDADASMKAAVMIMQEETIPLSIQTIGILDQIRKFLSAKAETAGHEITTGIDQTILWTAIVSAFGLLMGLLAAVLISLSIIRPIKRVTAFAAQLKTGDLSAKLSEGKDEAGQMASALNAMVEILNEKADTAVQIAQGDLSQSIDVVSEKDRLGKALDDMLAGLNRMVGDLLTAAEQVDAGSRQVADSSQSLSQGATEQAASLQEISSTVRQMSDQTKTNAENAGHANQLATDALSVSAEGADHMSQLTAAMAAIAEASNEISKIIKTIDAIAFQTNLLALNAAVEAARAGKHGKGFAVVAQEVRALSVRSAQAAQETATLIETAVNRVEDGNRIAGQTAAALENIQSGVTKVSDLISEIAAASTEQAQGISQVTQGLGQIDGVTQQNTANAEETSSAAVELAAQATQVRRLLERFTLRSQIGETQQAGEPDSQENAEPDMSPPLLDHAPRETVDVSPDDPNTPPETDPGVEEPIHIALDDSEFGKY